MQAAPVEDRMVVSEMGEQWSPNTAPASTAPIMSKTYSTLNSSAKSTAIGIIIAKVPQDVPVENAISAARAKIRAGYMKGGRVVPNVWAKYCPVCSSLTTPPIVQAKIRMVMAGSMLLKPLTAASGSWETATTPLGRKIASVKTTAAIPPSKRESAASVSLMASITDIPHQNSRQCKPWQ